MKHHHHQADQQRHQDRLDFFENEKKRKAKRKKQIMGGCGVALLLVVAIGAFSVFSPGTYDDFAKCLSEKGAVMFGEDWCPYTQGQKAMFGKSFKYVNYHVEKDLKLRPTWVINGETYQTVQSFERLAELTGCKY